MLYIIVTLLVCHINAISGQTLVLSGNSPYAVLGDPYIWQCVGKDYPGAVQKIAFKLNGTFICEVPIFEFTGNCSTNIVSPRVQCGCYENDMHRLYLNITKSIMADTGSWTCVLEDYIIQSSPVKHFVYYGPGSTVTINPPTHNISVKEGSEVKLICTASCLPPCSFRWLNDGVLVTNSSKLKLKNVQDKDTGSYICRVSNVVDTNSTSIYIQVLDEPKPPRDFKHVFSTSDTICLVWRAGDDGGASKIFHVEMVKIPKDPSSFLYWKPVGDDVDESLNGGPATSCLHDLDPSTSYNFRVYASNEHHIGNTSSPLQASTTGTGLSFSSGLGLGVVLGLGLVIFGLVLGICIILKRNKKNHSIYEDSDGTALVRNDQPD